MKKGGRSVHLIVLVCFILGSFSLVTDGNTSGIISINFAPYNEKKPATKNVNSWSIVGQPESCSKRRDDGLGLVKEGAKLVVKFQLPFTPQRAVLHINHLMEKPEEVEIKNKPSVRYKVNGNYLDQYVETDPPGAEKGNYWIDRWQMASLLKQGVNTFTMKVPNHYSHYYIRHLSIAYNAGRFQTSDVIHATTVGNGAILEYKKAYKGNIPGLAFYFYTLQEHNFIAGGEIYLDQIFALPSIGERIEFPYTQPASAATLYLNYLSPGISNVGVHPLQMVGALNGSISSLQSVLVRNEMKPNHAAELTNIAQEIFNWMCM